MITPAPDALAPSGLVVIATPTLTRPYPQYVAALEASIPALDAAGIRHATGFEVGCPYISCARATILRRALSAGAETIVFIDHDLSWRPEDLVSLIQTPGDVVSGLYRFKKDAEEFMGTIFTDDEGTPEPREDGCIRAERIPGGFLKITAAAVNRFMEAYPELVFGPRHTPSVDLFNHGAWDGVWWGEDYAFSRRWRAAGGDIWVQPDLMLIHHGDDIDYPGNFHTFLRRQPGGDLHVA